MLFLVVLASLVAFASTASAPLSHSGSPGANGGLSLVKPASVSSSRLKPAGSTSLGTVYPPGWPDHDYYYHVPDSSLTLKCYLFEDQPKQNATAFDNLFSRVIRIYDNPTSRDNKVWQTLNDPGEGSWGEPDSERADNWLVLHLFSSIDGFDYNLTEGEFAKALGGFNQVRLDYPMLDIHADIERNGALGDLAYMFFYFNGDPDPEVS